MDTPSNSKQEAQIAWEKVTSEPLRPEYRQSVLEAVRKQLGLKKSPGLFGMRRREWLKLAFSTATATAIGVLGFKTLLKETTDQKVNRIAKNLGPELMLFDERMATQGEVLEEVDLFRDLEVLRKWV